jgi:stage III sporulation protein AF
VLLVTLLRPLLGTDLSRLDLDRSDYAAAIQARQEELTAAGEEELAARIAERTEAYISDKGDELGLSVTARVTTETGADGVPTPFSVELWGQRSGQLAAYMEEELGIPGERQVWHEN